MDGGLKYFTLVSLVPLVTGAKKLSGLGEWVMGDTTLYCTTRAPALLTKHKGKNLLKVIP